MGSALVAGMIRGGAVDAADVLVVEKKDDVRAALSGVLPGVAVSDDLGHAESVVLAVKPQDAEEPCRALSSTGAVRVLSIVAGLTTARLEEWIGPGVAVVRAMPNTPALLGCGAAAVAAGSAATEDDLAWAEQALSAVGLVRRVSEELIDSVTGLSGSGPAYVFLLAEAMTAAGVEQGIDPTVSRDLAVRTILGAARMLDESGLDAATLRTNVTSPGGTTAAALAVFEERGLRATVSEAIAAATARGRELGG